MDQLHTFYKAFGHRVASGNIVRDGDGLQWVVDVLEWMTLGKEFADELSPDGMDALPAAPADWDDDPLEWVLGDVSSTCMLMPVPGRWHNALFLLVL